MRLTIHTDGGALRNPGPAGIGFLIHEDEKLLYSHAEAIGVTTNNVAEYTSLIRALAYVRDHFAKATSQITCIADSELMVRQMNRVYKVKHPDLLPLWQEVRLIVQEMNIPITYIHVLRDKNTEADALVKKALGR